MFPPTYRMGPEYVRPNLALRSAQSFLVNRCRAFVYAALPTVCGFFLFSTPLLAAPPENAPLPPSRVVETDESRAMDAIKEQIVNLFEKRDYPALEALAERYRNDRNRFSSGTSALALFHDAFAQRPQGTTDEEWEKTISGLEEWSQANPGSPTPKLALTAVWVSYGWKARGNGTGNTVTGERNRIFMERLAKAQAALEEAKPMRAKCPDYYSVLQGLALGQGWDKETYSEVCSEGEKQFPDNYSVYMGKCYFLQPKWYGRDPEWQNYLRASADKFGGEDGDLLYARVIGNLDAVTTNIMTSRDISWDRVKKGYEVMLKRYPNALNALSHYAGLAVKATDWPLARKLFTQLDNRVVLPIWKTQANFEKARNQALLGYTANGEPRDDHHYTSIDLSRLENYKLQGFWEAPTGHVLLGGVPFEIPATRGSLQTKGVGAPGPNNFQIPMEVRKPTDIYILLNGNFVRPQYAGKKVGEFIVTFKGGKKQNFPITAWKTLRETWSFDDAIIPPQVEGNPHLENIYAEMERRGDKPATGFLDMYVIKLDHPNWNDELSGIEVRDLSDETVHDVAPSLIISAITVKHD